MKIRILVATHKPYWMPEDEIYLPVQVGFADELGFERDNTGDNISSKNSNYCELTAMYWAWKNLDADYIGLAHYRRHFTVKKGGDKQTLPVTGKELEPLLKEHDVILPRKRYYYIETTYNQYIHAHHKEDLDTARKILEELYPDYLDAFDAVMGKTSGHRFNMFIMKKEIFNEYCKWLFDILFELEKRLDISSYNTNDSRVFGFVGERLLDVWINKNGIAYKEIPYVFMEKQNWIKKGGAFLKRKVTSGKSKKD
ncbi:DUF4422 domain-containing protein [Butyrivibrio sp. AE2032]|uniref:DUF4422 domain-containing protein n=1 Tax=Butyrivibrio sp. AE2032 TaxID=1458463 RepID=UPI00054E43CE|nr:DUF4422 domain-containing protein [Butyrivibrio sp. AE2032]